MGKEFLQAGQVVGTHGIKGELRVQPWCDTPGFLAKLKTLYFDEGGESISVKSRAHKNIVLVAAEGIDSIEKAETLRGRVLYLKRSDVVLEEGRYFVEDLIGMKVVDVDSGHEYGTLTDISPTGANDVYHIKTPAGEVLIPSIPLVVIERDVETGVMKIRPLKGLFEGSEEVK